MTLMLVSGYEDAAAWRTGLAEAAPELELRVWPEAGALADIIMLAADGVVPDGLFARLPNLRCIQYLGHGAADVLNHPELPGGVAVARLTDARIIRCMNEYVLAYLLGHRWNVAQYGRQQQAGRWAVCPLADERATRIGVLGLGSIGTRVATTLAGLGFAVSGWARGPHAIEGVDCRHGADALKPLLAELDYIVCILPGTVATRDLLDAGMFAAMKPGAHLINVGRGSVVDEGALVAALDGGRIDSATLDVFAAEPLPSDSPLWGHAKVTITPHVAGGGASGAIAATAENYRRVRAGEPPLHIADPARGY